VDASIADASTTRRGMPQLCRGRRNAAAAAAAAASATGPAILNLEKKVTAAVGGQADRPTTNGRLVSRLLDESMFAMQRKMFH